MLSNLGKNGSESICIQKWNNYIPRKNCGDRDSIIEFERNLIRNHKNVTGNCALVVNCLFQSLPGLEPAMEKACSSVARVEYLFLQIFFIVDVSGWVRGWLSELGNARGTRGRIERDNEEEKSEVDLFRDAWTLQSVMSQALAWETLCHQHFKFCNCGESCENAWFILSKVKYQEQKEIYSTNLNWKFDLFNRFSVHEIAHWPNFARIDQESISIKCLLQPSTYRTTRAFRMKSMSPKATPLFCTALGLFRSRATLWRLCFISQFAISSVVLMQNQPCFQTKKLFKSIKGIRLFSRKLKHFFCQKPRIKCPLNAQLGIASLIVERGPTAKFRGLLFPKRSQMSSNRARLTCH